MMPRYKVTSPEGHSYVITAPDGASNEQVMTYAQQQFSNINQDQGSVPTKSTRSTRQSIARTALEQGLQGATFGFADEITDRIGSAIGAIATDESYDDLLKEARKQSKKRLSEQQKQHPYVSLASGVGGALLTGGAGASTKAGTAVSNSLRSGGLAARVAKGAAAGATSGGLYGAGAAEDGNRLEGAKTGAALGAAFGGAVPGVAAATSSAVKGAKNAYAGMLARSSNKLDDAAEIIRQRGAEAYQAMRNSGATFNTRARAKILTRLDNALNRDGKLNPKLHDKIVAVSNQMKEEIKKGELTLEGLDQWRQVLGDVAGNFNDKVNARKAKLLINTIDDIVDKTGAKDLSNGGRKAIEALKTGRTEWARLRKFEAITDIVKKSDGDVNKLKRELQKFVSNPKKIRQFSRKEQEALRYAAQNSTGEKLLKSFGKLGFDLGSSLSPGNTFLPVLGSAAGIAGIPTATPLVIGGTLSRQAQKAIGAGKVENLLRILEGKTPTTPAFSASKREQLARALTKN